VCIHSIFIIISYNKIIKNLKSNFKVKNVWEGMMNMMGYGYGIGWFGMIIPLLLIALIIYAVVRLTQSSNGNNNGKNIENDAFNILNQRYAKGEISEEEYIQKKKMLRD